MKKSLALKYVNSRGEEVDFGGKDYNHEGNEMRSHEWKYEISNGKVKRFYKEPVERNISIWIDSWLESVGFNQRDRLIEVAEYDIRNNVSGRFWAGDYYTDGNVIASEPSGYIVDGRVMVTSNTVLLPRPDWYRDHTYQFYIDATPGGGEWLDYPYDYPYDYKAMPPSRSLTNPSTFSTEFTLTVFGPAKNPTVQIGQNTYQVMYEIARGDRLVIDSRKREIYVIEVTGRMVDVFGYRKKGSVGSGSYIFEKIPTGYSNVVIDNSFGFDLTIHEEGSVPRWS